MVFCSWVLFLRVSRMFDPAVFRISSPFPWPLYRTWISCTISDSGHGILFSVEGMGLGFALLLGFYMYGGMGAGDVKLLAAIGAVVGPFNVFVGFLFASLLGGLYAVAVMVWHLGLARTAERIEDHLGQYGVYEGQCGCFFGTNRSSKASVCACHWSWGH